MPAVTNKKIRPIAIDLFCGAGGLSLGLEQAGFDIALGIDRDGHHIAAHERNFPYGKALCASITDIDRNKILELVSPRKEVDLVCGGPPCQGFSQMGINDASDSRNTLVDEFVRIIDEVRPKAFLMENVPGMQRGKTKAIFQRAVRKLERLGYVVTLPARTLNAIDFGVPQHRERLFVVGIREELGREIEYPDGLCDGQPVRPTVAEALMGLPYVETDESLYTSDLALYPKDNSSDLPTYVQVARGIARDRSDFSYPRKWDQKTCSGCIRIKHRADIVELYDATPAGTMVPGHKLPKLNPDGYCPTLRAGSESEYGSHTAPRPVHPIYPRCITPREAARLHGYPDWFRFYPLKWHAYRQIGNSVCPPIARALGTAILKALQAKPHRPRKSIMLTDDFHLPENRLKQHRRITQTKEWPKILNHLLDQARSKSGRLSRPDFSVEDVKAAYKATDANMPRNPANRFLSDIARSRNVKKILAPILEQGLSIIHVGDNGVYGRFVPADTPGTLEDRDWLSISSKEIGKAIRIKPLPNADVGDFSLIKYLSHRDVASEAFAAKSLEIDADRNLFGEIDNGKALYSLVPSRGRRRKGVVVASRKSKMPTLSTMCDYLQTCGVSEGSIICSLTRRHFAVISVSLRGERCRETGRTVFQVY